MYGPWSAVKAKAAAHEIMGTSSVTVDQMVSYYNKRYTFPADTYRDKGADSAEAFFKILKEEAEAEGVRADVLFAQVMLETGGLTFGGDVQASQCNFGGLGAVGGGAAGETYADVRTGLRAQVQHLKAYASTEGLNNACVDTLTLFQEIFNTSSSEDVIPVIFAFASVFADFVEEYAPTPCLPLFVL